MKSIKVYSHGPYIGNTGYNNHTRDFLDIYQITVKLKLEILRLVKHGQQCLKNHIIWNPI